MTIEISCPNCGEEFRVRDEAAGKAFKCKVCGTTVRIPDVEVIDDDDEDDYPPARRRSRRDDDDEDDDRPKKRKRKSSSGSKTLGPAIGLYVVSGLWLAYCLVSGALQIMNPMPLPPGNDQAQIVGYYIGYYGVIIGFPIITLFILFGAFCLQTRRIYALAMIACILASMPCCSPGCILGMPFGIWGLVVLMQEDVKRSFE